MHFLHIILLSISPKVFSVFLTLVSIVRTVSPMLSSFSPCFFASSFIFEKFELALLIFEWIESINKPCSSTSLTLSRAKSLWAFFCSTPVNLPSIKSSLAWADLTSSFFLKNLFFKISNSFFCSSNLFIKGFWFAKSSSFSASFSKVSINSSMFFWISSNCSTSSWHLEASSEGFKFSILVLNFSTVLSRTLRLLDIFDYN